MKVSCKSRAQRRRGCPSAPSSRALSIYDGPTTEKVIFEDAPLINAFYRIKNQKRRLHCSTVNSNVLRYETNVC